MNKRSFPVAVMAASAFLSARPAPLSFSADGEQMKVEELVARHLESIGTAEARAGVTSRVVNGTVQVTFRLGTQGQLEGKGTILSDKRNFRLGMKFSHKEYPGEQVAFDGNKITVGIVRPGVRSDLSSFLYQYDFLVKEGLIGGTTSTGWCLLDVAGRNPKLEYRGLKNIDGRQLHELRYRAKKGAGTIEVVLYFDPGTFTHVLSLYSLKVPAYMARTSEESARQQDAYYRIREEFGAFKQVDGLTLPHSYKLIMTIEGQSHTFLADWTMDVSQIVHNQQLDAAYFRVQ